MDEKSLIEKLIKIEAIHSGAATEGERISADLARQRILVKLKEMLSEDPSVEYKFTFPDMWSRKVFVSLLRRYMLKPYRYPGQRYTTVMVQVPGSFVDETLWPEFQEINSELGSYLQQVTDRVVKKVLHEDISEAVVVDTPISTDMPKEGISTETASLPFKEEADRNKKKKRKKRKKRKRKR